MSSPIDAMQDSALVQRYRALLDLSECLVIHSDLGTVVDTLVHRLPAVVHVNFVAVSLHEPDTNTMRLHMLKANIPADITGGHVCAMDESPAGWVWDKQAPLIVDDITQETRWPRVMRLMHEDGIKSFCSVPLTTASGRIGAMGFASITPAAYADGDAEFLQQIARQVAIAIDNALAYQKITELNKKLEHEKHYLEEEIRTEHRFDEIIGDSAALKNTLRQVEVVAPTDSTVLILGETGTGKELIARAIHRLSGRRERTFVKLNCAAIPTGLLESELFGHERGAFTGAIARKVGRFELADGGTLFLDEVGDVPLELQSKLLRVLQEQEFERLGSTRTIKVDVRLVAATNRDLVQMVGDKEFRSDLYYRLNVFPIVMPALRERREDVPVLTRYFTEMYGRRMGKPVNRISSETLEALSGYDWPGNIRELENLIERAVILSSGPEQRVPLGELKRTAPPFAANHAVTLEAAERDHIVRALDAANWVIGGPDGAAKRLGMKRTTLQSRMQKLGISRTS
ncbi:MAG TPA: sigma 54-interacting transcriptional regulator [Nitrospirales bacterium]|nr:sigma 54-interacting transcriptional regulator [Nitrospirales bacterium]